MPQRAPRFRLLATSEEAPSVAAQSSLRAARTPAAPVRFGSTGGFMLKALGNPDVSRIQELVVEETLGAQARLHRLPITTYDAFAKARPGRVEDGYSRDITLLSDHIGPWQLEGATLWFGKTFYDGEGETGVGGSGYFDEGTKAYRVITSPEIAEWSVAVMFVEREAVWLALVRHPEGPDIGGGVVRFDRRLETLRHFDVGTGVGFQFLPVSGRMVLVTDQGLALLQPDEARDYFIDRTTDGRYIVAESTK